MPLADRDIIITPNRGQSSEPNIAFRGADAASSATVTLRVYNSSTVGSISFEGNAGQLMSVVDSLSGTIFSVNDISGMPSIEVLDTGEIRLAQYGGGVNIAGITTVTNTTNASSTLTGALQVRGGAGIGGNLYVGGTIFGLASVSGTITTATSLAGGALGQIPYQTAAGATQFIGTGASGSILQMGATTATFVTTSSIHVGTANFAVSASTASQVTTIAQTANATYFLTFVDANNATSLVETIHTTSSFTVNAASGGVRIGGITTITNTTAATSTVTGALQVVGGIGVGRDSYFNGVLIGRGAGSVATNTVLGNGVLDTNTTGTDNIAVGYLSLNSNTTGRYNTAVGSNTLIAQTTDYHNTAIGYNALRNNSGGSNNVAVGSDAGYTNSSGINNSLLGHRAGFAITSGGYNSAFGTEALNALTTQSFNSAFGYRALYSNTSGTANTAIGSNAGDGITTAQYSVGIGYQALEGSGSPAVTGDYNTAVGGQSIRLITSGTRNTGVGFQSLYQVGGQSYNTAVGAYSQINNFGGSYNTSLGDNSLYAVSTGQYNIAIGYQAGNSITTGTSNTIIGSVSGTAGMTATVIVAAGTAERFRIDSVGNMGIGTTSPSALLDVNGTVGVRSATNATSSSTGALQVTGGAGIGGDLWVGGTAYATVLQSTSDVNFKKDITTITNALNTVLQLRGVEYKWKHNSEPGLGLIAQEVQPLVPAAVAESGDRLTVGYGNMVGLLVEAIKEQQQQILALQQEIRDLKR